ncbi:MAG: ribbon-helix-helix protein, CopG family [Chloroflexi bacterium]|nr:ribbon-helix-helix protein, CopG family [Chloroflexota bacterium]
MYSKVVTQVGRLARKNLVVDGEKVKELARKMGTSESEAVRQAVDFVLAAEEVMAAVRELHERGGIDDVLGKLPDEVMA